MQQQPTQRQRLQQQRGCLLMAHTTPPCCHLGSSLTGQCLARSHQGRTAQTCECCSGTALGSFWHATRNAALLQTQDRVRSASRHPVARHRAFSPATLATRDAHACLVFSRVAVAVGAQTTRTTQRRQQQRSQQQPQRSQHHTGRLGTPASHLACQASHPCRPQAHSRRPRTRKAARKGRPGPTAGASHHPRPHPSHPSRKSRSSRCCSRRRRSRRRGRSRRASSPRFPGPVRPSKTTYTPTYTHGHSRKTSLQPHQAQHRTSTPASPSSWQASSMTCQSSAALSHHHHPYQTIST